MKNVAVQLEQQKHLLDQLLMPCRCCGGRSDEDEESLFVGWDALKQRVDGQCQPKKTSIDFTFSPVSYK